MIELNTSRFKLPPYKHQLEGVKTLLKKPVYGLFWEMRLGKTKTIIDTACTLFDANEIDVVVIAAPAQVTDVWADSELGEIRKHAWDSQYKVLSYRYNARLQGLFEAGIGFVTPCFITTSLEFLRQEDAFGDFPKVDSLIKALADKRFWLVVDEGSAIANSKALQTKAVHKLRAKAARVTMLDGTPAGNSPADLYAKFSVLNKEILGYKSFWEYSRAHAKKQRLPYKVRGRWIDKIVGWENMEVVTQRSKPFCEYLKQTDALDMPEKVRTFFTVPLKPATWKVYRQLRDELFAELDPGQLLLKNSASKITRLAQICAGFVGGVEDEAGVPSVTKELSSESTDAFINWLGERLEENHDFKCVVWCRWRPEIERLKAKIQWMPAWVANKHAVVGLTYGGTKDANFLHPDYPHKGAAVMIAQPQAARFGVNFSKASDVVYLSQGYDLVTRSQSEDRVQAPNGRKTTLMIDVIVTGPDGQKTIVHDVIKAIRDKEDIARRTTDQWRKVLSE